MSPTEIISVARCRCNSRVVYVGVVVAKVPLADVFSPALQERRATAVTVKERHLVAKMCTLQTNNRQNPRAL
jgi:hypothetical protein